LAQGLDPFLREIHRTEGISLYISKVQVLLMVQVSAQSAPSQEKLQSEYLRLKDLVVARAAAHDPPLPLTYLVIQVGEADGSFSNGAYIEEQHRHIMGLRLQPGKGIACSLGPVE
jgi:hypothetical protein